jgi:hypothetical protein
MFALALCYVLIFFLYLHVLCDIIAQILTNCMQFRLKIVLDQAPTQPPSRL